MSGISKALKLSAVGLSVSAAMFISGCSNGNLEAMVNDAKAKAEAAAAAVDEAMSAAETADEKATEALIIAKDADAKASKAAGIAKSAQFTADRNSQKLDKMFKKCMRK
ncbi:MAG: hypothetical protein D6B27_06330 [Gammaproteobacteria bacterium]|nr:MAG: hypothetical protein D6B27_06330 [Gammaproteobacteria bacterium]